MTLFAEMSAKVHCMTPQMVRNYDLPSAQFGQKLTKQLTVESRLYTLLLTYTPQTSHPIFGETLIFQFVVRLTLG